MFQFPPSLPDATAFEINTLNKSHISHSPTITVRLAQLSSPCGRCKRSRDRFPSRPNWRSVANGFRTIGSQTGQTGTRTNGLRTNGHRDKRARHRCDVFSKLCRPGAKPQRWAPPLVTLFSVIPRV